VSSSLRHVRVILPVQRDRLRHLGYATVPPCRPDRFRTPANSRPPKASPERILPPAFPPCVGPIVGKSIDQVPPATHTAPARSPDPRRVIVAAPAQVVLYTSRLPSAASPSPRTRPARRGCFAAIPSRNAKLVRIAATYAVARGVQAIAFAKSERVAAQVRAVHQSVARVFSFSTKAFRIPAILLCQRRCASENSATCRPRHVRRSRRVHRDPRTRDRPPTRRCMCSTPVRCRSHQLRDKYVLPPPLKLCIGFPPQIRRIREARHVRLASRAHRNRCRRVSNPDPPAACCYVSTG